jgi:hypothetical protein
MQGDYTMEAVYRLKPHELTESFFNLLKNSFFDKEIEVSVEEVEDTTDYLLRSSANREILLDGIKAAETGNYAHTMTFEEAESQI